MTYVDGFVLAVPRDKLDDYWKIAESAGKVWMEHGALDYKECLVDHDHIEGMRSFAETANAKPDEAVIFAYIVYASREKRDEVNKKVMEDPRIKCDPQNMPFDCSRMSYGGFTVKVDGRK